MVSCTDCGSVNFNSGPAVKKQKYSWRASILDHIARKNKNKIEGALVDEFQICVGQTVRPVGLKVMNLCLEVRE